MEHTRTRPMVWLALAALVLALLAASRLTGELHGPVCAEAAPTHPGFAALAAGPGPACIRIRLH
ncbi:MAG: hypothetical protein ABIM50_08535 [Novosphingobium sp.]